MKNVYKKVFNVMSKVGRVSKDGTNSFHKYSYVTAANVVESVKPLLIEEGLLILPSVVESVKEGESARIKMEYTIVDVESGEEIRKMWDSEGNDKTDKGFNKAYTSGYKYFLMNLFDIPSGDDPEADVETDKRAYSNTNSNNFLSSEKEVKTLISSIYSAYDSEKAKKFIGEIRNRYDVKDLKELSNETIDSIKKRLKEAS